MCIRDRNKEHLLPIEKSRLGVIGGSGFYSMDQIKYLREIEINTPYGKPSDSIRVYNLGNLEIAFIPRHGRTHRLNPSEIPVSYTHLTLPTKRIV